MTIPTWPSEPRGGRHALSPKKPSRSRGESFQISNSRFGNGSNQTWKYLSRRNRRGKGVRASLIPSYLPFSQRRSFDALALEAYAPLTAQWGPRLDELDLAVDDIPRVLPKDPDRVVWPDEVTHDGPIPLARLIPATIDSRGLPVRARIVLFRRPLELRAKMDIELLYLVREVLIQQIAHYLGIDEDDVLT